ncbi:hypothetical protein CRG86_002805 [Photobacterium leiognathi]|nr:hypothetical protein CRG86_002805 [Photobacterium leiognathi]
MTFFYQEVGEKMSKMVILSPEKRNNNTVDIEVIEQLCDYLDITVGELFEIQKDSETD